MIATLLLSAAVKRTIRHDQGRGLLNHEGAAEIEVWSILPRRSGSDPSPDPSRQNPMRTLGPTRSTHPDDFSNRSRHRACPWLPVMAGPLRASSVRCAEIGRIEGSLTGRGIRSWSVSGKRCRFGDQFSSVVAAINRARAEQHVAWAQLRQGPARPDARDTADESKRCARLISAEWSAPNTSGAVPGGLSAWFHGSAHTASAYQVLMIR
jgi:hypothetical protein